MIRVNLLPHKRGPRGAESAPQASQRWLLVVLGAIVLEVLALVLFHRKKLEELQDQRNIQHATLRQDRRHQETLRKS